MRSGDSILHDLKKIVDRIPLTPQFRLKGVFCHEGHAHGAKDSEECKRFLIESQERVLRFVSRMSYMGIKAEIVSIGSTPSLIVGEMVKGITEICPGTYVFFLGGKTSSNSALCNSTFAAV